MRHCGKVGRSTGVGFFRGPVAHFSVTVNSVKRHGISIGSCLLRANDLLLFLLLIPTLGLLNMARSTIRGQHTRVKIHGTFKTACNILIHRVLCRGDIVALVNNLINLLLSLLLLPIYGSFLLRDHSATLDKSVVFRPTIFLLTLFFDLLLGLLSTNVPTVHVTHRGVIVSLGSKR